MICWRRDLKMSSINTGNSDLKALENLLVDFAIDYLVDEEVNSGGYNEHREVFHRLSFDGSNYDAPEDYLSRKFDDFLVNEESDYKGNENLVRVKELLLRLSFIRRFGGSLCLDIKDLILVDSIQQYKYVSEVKKYNK